MAERRTDTWTIVALIALRLAQLDPIMFRRLAELDPALERDIERWSRRAPFYEHPFYDERGEEVLRRIADRLRDATSEPQRSFAQPEALQSSPRVAQLADEVDQLRSRVAQLEQLLELARRDVSRVESKLADTQRAAGQLGAQVHRVASSAESSAFVLGAITGDDAFASLAMPRAVALQILTESDDDAAFARVRDAALRFGKLLGLEIDVELERERGSRGQRALAWLKGFFTRAEVQTRLQEGEAALRANADKAAAENAKALADAAASLINSIKDMDGDACLEIGPLLVAKECLPDGRTRLMVRALSPVEAMEHQRARLADTTVTTRLRHIQATIARVEPSVREIGTSEPPRLGTSASSGLRAEGGPVALLPSSTDDESAADDDD